VSNIAVYVRAPAELGDKSARMRPSQEMALAIVVTKKARSAIAKRFCRRTACSGCWLRPLESLCQRMSLSANAYRQSAYRAIFALFCLY